MIFLSHNYNDKDVVEPIAVKLKEIYGEKNVFYDSWSIKPGESIIGKMNTGIENCKYFLFFLSKNSLNSSMVGLEWQSALYKAAKEGIKFIPIKLDDCYPPQILTNTLYIDMYTVGIENTLRDIFDIIENRDSKQYKSFFENLIYQKKVVTLNEIHIVIKAVKLIEPNKFFLIAFSNDIQDIQVIPTSESMVISSAGSVGGLNYKSLKFNNTLTPQFPLRITVKSKSKEIMNLKVLHQYSEEYAKEIREVY